MVPKLISLRLMLVSLATLLLGAALACGSAEPVAAPEVDTAAIAAAVTKSITESAPKQVTSAEIQAMVQAAVQAGPGVSKADLETAIGAQAGGQMTAADVKTVVDAAIASMPAPQLDTTALRPLVEQAIRRSVPEGVSATEIAKLVEAAVTGATKNVPTRGELEASITKSVQEAAAGQLTAAQVKTIVAASIEAATADIAKAAAIEASRAAAQEVTKAIATLPTLGEGDRPGFKKIILPVQERPNIDPGTPLAAKQELEFSLHYGLRGEVRPPYVWGNIDYIMSRWVFSPPFRFGPKTTGYALRQGFATGYSISDDGLRFLLHLNPDAILQDNTPITASLVKRMWEFSARPEEQLAWGAILNHSKFIEGISAVASGDAKQASGLIALDDRTLMIKLTELRPVFPMELALWLYGAFSVDQAENDREGFKIAPIGAGPFIATYNIADGAETFTATPNWWGPEANIKKVRMTLIPDRQVSLIRYENNETDLLFADAGNIPSIWNPEHARHKDLLDMGGFGLWWYSFVQDHEPFDDINMRKAIAHGMDVSTVMTAVMGPLSLYPAGITPPGEACYQTGTEYVYDVALAKQHLAASRYVTGDKVPPITVAVSSGYATYVRMWEVLQEQLKTNLDITINIIRLEAGQQPPDTVELQGGALGKRIPDPSTMLSDFGGQIYRGAKNNQHLPWNNPTLAAQLLKAQTTQLTDPSYCANWQAVETFLIDDYAYLPWITADPRVWFMQPWILGPVGSWAYTWPGLPYWKVGVKDRTLYE